MKREGLSKCVHRLAQVGIYVEFLAFIRTLAQFLRLEYVRGPTLQISTVAPYGGAGLLAAVLTSTGVLCYFASRDRVTLSIARVTVLALLPWCLSICSPIALSRRISVGMRIPN